jgi:hypothetical protein
MIGENVVIIKEETISGELSVQVETGGMDKETIGGLLTALQFLEAARRELTGQVMEKLQE